MPEPIRLFVVPNPARQDVDVYAEATLKHVGIPCDDSTAAHFGGQGAWRTLTFHAPTGGTKKAIRRKCIVGDPEIGFRFDDTLWDGAACEVVVASWTGFPSERPGMAAYDALEMTLGETLTELINAHLTPGSLSNPFFTLAWRNKQKPSDPPAPETSAGSISTPA